MSITELPIWVQGVIIFMCQYLFIFFRTKNVEANAAKNRKALFVTGFFVNITWLLSVGLGVNAVINGHWVLIFCNLAGGLIGADHAIINLWKRKE